MMAVLLVAMLSCEDELTTIPKDTITDQGITFSANEMEMYANQFYTSLPGTMAAWAWESDAASDNNVPASFTSYPLAFGTQTIPASGGGWNWGNIRNVNFSWTIFLSPKRRNPLKTSIWGKYYFLRPSFILI